MPTDVPAEVLAGDVPLCSECLEHEGLCFAHAKHVLPQLAQPHWYRLIGTPLLDERQPRKEETPAVKKAKRRTARRFERAMAGEFTRSRTAA